MNQRIRELAVQSDTYAHNRMAEIGGSYLEYHSEKFAQLIVRECITSLDENDGSVHHSKCLLEHFGVEE